MAEENFIMFIPLLSSSTQLHKNSKPTAEESFIPISSTSTMIRPRKSIIKKSRKRGPLIVISSSESPWLKKFKAAKKKPKKEEYPHGSFWVGERKLGVGGFGTVYLVRTNQQNDTVSSFPPIMANKTAPLEKAETLKYERQIFSRYLKGCPYIVNCYGAEITVGGVNGDKIYNLFLEFCSEGSLWDRITKSTAGLPEHEVKWYTRDILRGLKYIHNNKIAHLDIKPANILLVSCGYKDSCLAKITDFGLCKNLTMETEESPHTRGTYRYMSPEIVERKIMSYPADIWALGCTIVEMLTASLLRGYKFDNAFGGKIPKEISGEARDFLEKCFIRDPSHRWTAEMLLQHPFLDF